jgi:hypothetical protein
VFEISRDTLDFRIAGVSGRRISTSKPRYTRLHASARIRMRLHVPHTRQSACADFAYVV